MRLQIGICDDEVLIAEKLKNIVVECLEDLRQEGDVFIFLSGKELLKKIQHLKLVFLDVKMEEMDGYETGCQIISKNPDCLIIMASGISMHFEKAFEIGAIRYIRKPFCKDKIKEALQEILSKMGESKKITLFKNRNKYDINQTDIKYIRAYNGYTEYYVGNEIFRSEESLCHVEKELDTGLFFRAHKRYLINLQYVTRKQDGSIMIDKTPIPVSRRRKSEFDKAFIRRSFSER